MEDTSKLFASFVHDWQIAKVLRADGEAYIYHQPDLAAPLFDFGYVFSDADLPIGEINRRAIVAIRDGDFRLPFPTVWYLARHRDPDTSGLEKGRDPPFVFSPQTPPSPHEHRSGATSYQTILIYAEQDDATGDVTSHSFQRTPVGWMHGGFRWRIGSYLADTANIDYEVLRLKRKQTDAEAAYVMNSMRATNLLLECCTMLLMSSNHERETLEHHDTAVRINARRAKMGKPELPRIIRISLDGRPIFPARADAGGGGWSVRGHNRRTHERHLPNGKVITIRATKVKGGAQAQQIYKVDKDKPDDEGE